MTFSTVNVRSSRDLPGITSALKVTFISGLAQIRMGFSPTVDCFLKIGIVLV